LSFSEFLEAKKGAEAFFLLIDRLIADGGANRSSAGRTHEQEYDWALHTATPLLRGKAEVSLLKFALYLRIYSPRVQVHKQVAGEYPQSSQCDVFVDVSGHVTCSVEELDSLVRRERIEADSPPSVYSIDHVHPWSGNETGKHIAVLYADVDRPELFEPFHRKLKEAAKNGQLALYVFRHFKRASTESNGETKVGLSGYGVELAIKNTEYKAIDDSNSKGQAEEEESEDEGDFQGFNFGKLKRLHEHLKPSLQQFKTHLAEQEELSPLKQWEVAELSYQAAQRILDVPPEEALSMLVDLSQNFPIRARSIAQTKVKKAFKEGVQANQRKMTDELELSEGDNALYINGIGVDVETLDAFQLFHMVQDEEMLANAFFQMGFRVSRRRPFKPIIRLNPTGHCSESTSPSSTTWTFPIVRRPTTPLTTEMLTPSTSMTSTRTSTIASGATVSNSCCSPTSPA